MSAIEVTRDGAVATVLLNAPERMNAMNLEMFSGISAAMAELDDDHDIRCVIFRGAGGKAFAAGADISEFEQKRSTREQAVAYAAISNPAMAAVQACRHPTLALIEGACVGGGLGLAAMCDLRISTQSARFGVPIKRLGLVESPEELRPLVAKFGVNALLEILLVGDLLSADDALRLGLVNKVVADDAIDDAGAQWARKIAEGAPLSARWHKKFLYRLLDPTPLTDAELDEGYDCFDSADFQTGFRAFLDKSKPVFEGR
jgi:enoyl-CoA hydratase/carnithine racemase